MNQMETQENITENSNMELNLDILQKQGNTVSYLGDLYGYQVFSSEFEEAIKKAKEDMKTELDNSFEYVLTNKPEPIIDEAFHAVITGEAQVVIKNEYSRNTAGISSGTIIGSVLMGMMVTAVILIIIEKKRKGKSLNEGNRNDYRAYFE